MKQEKTLFAIAIILLVLMIAATVICAIKYMHEETIWNREPVAAVTGAPEADEPEGITPEREIVTENQPPGIYTDTIILNNGGDGDAAD